jgi:hypothetical protein
MKFTHKWVTGYAFRLLWLVGLWVLTQIAFTAISSHGSINYKTLHLQLFIDSAVYCALGAYLAVLFVQNWRPRLNIPVLIFVFLPCAIVSVCQPIMGVESPLWLTKASTMGISSITAGASIIFGLFGAAKLKTPEVGDRLERNAGEIP